MGLRHSKHTTDMKVEILHYNESGKGKIWETDGTNTYIRVLIEQEICDRKTYGYHTPTSELEAQTFNSKIRGYLPVII